MPAAKTVKDTELEHRLFLIDSQRNGDHLQVEYAMNDDVVGIYSQWVAEGDFDPAAGTIANVQLVSANTVVSRDTLFRRIPAAGEPVVGSSGGPGLL